MTTKSTHKIANACLYFNSPLSFPIKQSTFQQHLSTLEDTDKNKLLQYRIQELLIQRYYEIANNFQQHKIQQYLILRFLRLFDQLIGDKRQNNEQELIVVIWASVTHLKKSVPQNQNKQLIKAVLLLIKIVIGRLLKLQNCKPQAIYPQLSATLMHFVTHSHLINHTIFATSLSIMAQLIDKIFQSRLSSSLVQTNFNLNLNESRQKCFEHQCLSRLQTYFKILANKVTSMQLVYYDSIGQFIQKIWKIGQKYVKILPILAIIGELISNPLPQQNLPSSLTKLIQSSVTKQFISIIDTPKQHILHHNSILQKLQKLSHTIKPTQQQCQYILLKFTNYLYLIRNTKSLIIPHSEVKQSLHLIKLQKQHSFANYPIGISSLLQSFQFECERILILKIPFAETNLANIGLLKKILQKLSQNVANMLLSSLLQALILQQNQYMVDMSLTKFCQFLTKILMVYWLVRKIGNKLHSDIALNLFQTLSSCQAIRILQPSFEQQQILIGFTLLICYNCYNSLTHHKSDRSSQKQLSEIKKLKLKLTMIQMSINNIYQQSYIIRSAAYYIILSQSAPFTITQFLANSQSTLINRNINNINFIISLIQLCTLSGIQCQDLADKFMQYAGSQQLIRILLPRLKTQTIRKCLLSAANQRGKWIHMLQGNSKLLLNMKIQQGQQLESKVDNFYMNDGSNVRITNALGVILLELGNKWQHVLKIDSPYKDPALDLLIQLVRLDSNMVFFKNRFVAILNSLFQIISQPQFNKQANLNSTSQRTRKKIYKIISKIPNINFKFYKKAIQVPNTNFLPFEISKNFLTNFLQNIRQRHKKYQLNYLMNSADLQASQMYDNSDSIITNLVNALEDNNQQQNKEELNI